MKIKERYNDLTTIRQEVIDRLTFHSGGMRLCDYFDMADFCLKFVVNKCEQYEDLPEEFKSQFCFSDFTRIIEDKTY